MVLYVLYTMGSIIQKEIGDNFGLLKPTVSTVIRDLKSNEYVALIKCTDDKREKMLYACEMVGPLLFMQNMIK